MIETIEDSQVEIIKNQTNKHHYYIQSNKPLVSRPVTQKALLRVSDDPQPLQNLASESHQRKRICRADMLIWDYCVYVRRQERKM